MGSTLGAAVAMVYIAEAHARDEWPVGDAISFCNQPKSMQARFELARALQCEKGLAVPVLVDTMEDTFLKEMAPWPLRFYVVQDGKLLWKAQPKESCFGFDITELEEWLKCQV